MNHSTNHPYKQSKYPLKISYLKIDMVHSFPSNSSKSESNQKHKTKARLDSGIYTFKQDKRNYQMKCESTRSWASPFIQLDLEKVAKRPIILFSPKNNNTIHYMIQAFPRKSLLENAMTLIQYPNSFKIDNGENLFILLLEKLEILISGERTKPIIQSYNFSIPSKLTQLAIESFFKNCCQVFSLFSKRDFNFNTYSKPLKMAILASGLTWMEQTKEVKEVLKSLEKGLYNYCIAPSAFKTELNSIQAILILLIHLSNFPFTHKFRGNLVLHCQRLSSILGLHKECYRAPPKVMFERKLSYCCLNFVSTFVDLSCSSQLSNPFKLPEFMMPNQVRKLSISQQLFSKYINGNLDMLFDIIFSDFLSNIAGIMFLLKIFKVQLELDPQVKYKIDQFSYKIKLQLKDIKSVYITKLNELSRIDVKMLYSCRLSSLKSVLLIFVHYIQFFLISLKFYYPLSINSNKPESNENRTKYQDNYDDVNISLGMLECRLCIEFSLNLPPQSMIFYSMPMLSQCLAFLIRYHIKVDCKESKIVIKKGFKKFTELKRNLVYYWLQKLNIKTLQFLSSLSG